MKKIITTLALSFLIIISVEAQTEIFYLESAHFDGTMINLEDNPIFDLPENSNITFEFDLKGCKDQLSEPTIIGKGARSNTNPGYWIWIRNYDSVNRIQFTLCDGERRKTYSSDPVIIFDQQWHTVKINIVMGDSLSIYLDGKFLNHFDLSAGEIKDASTDEQFLIGGSKYYQSNFCGDLRNFSIKNQ